MADGPDLVLGIDVGAKNLALCAIRPGADPLGTGDAIELWALTSTALSPRSLANAVRAAGVDELLPRVRDVVIERQPGRNTKTVRLQHYLEMLFALRDVRVHTQHSKRKLDYAAKTPWFPGTPTTTYYARKKAAVQTAAAFLAAVPQPPAAHEAFACKKQDDLADALLHAMAFAHGDA